MRLRAEGPPARRGIPARASAPAAILIAGFLLSCAPARGRLPRAGADPRSVPDLLEVESAELRCRPGDVAVLERLLESSFSTVRARAARALGRSPFTRDPAPLAALLRPGEYLAVRSEAAWALGAVGEPAALEALLAASRDPSPAVRSTAFRAIGRLGPAGLGGWSTWAADIDPMARRAAVLAAAPHPGIGSVEEWTALISTEADERVRWAVFHAVALRPDLRGELAGRLRTAAADPNFLAAAAALHGLRLVAGDRVPAEVLEAAADGRRFWMVRDAALQALAAYLARPDLHAGDRERAERIILAASDPEAPSREPPEQSSGPEVHPSLAPDGHRSPHERRRALAALPFCRGDGARERLSALLDRGDPAQISPLIEGLAAAASRPAGDPHAAEARERMEALGRDPREAVRVARVECLVDAATQGALAAALEDGSFTVRRAALRRMLLEGASVPAGAVASLFEERRIEEWPLRLLSVQWLERARPPEIRALLDRAIRDPAFPVSRAASIIWKDAAGGEPPAVEVPPAPSYAFLSPALSRLARRPRARISIEGKGDVLIELFLDEAPHHVSSFLDLLRRRVYDGRRIEASDGALVTLAGSSIAGDSVAGVPLPAECLSRACGRGSVISPPACGPGAALHGRKWPAWSAAGSVLIALRPMPGLDGRVACWGQVVLGMEVLDAFEEGDRIAEASIYD